MTEHRCISGKWKAGKVRDCKKCQAVRPPRTVKRSGET